MSARARRRDVVLEQPPRMLALQTRPLGADEIRTPYPSAPEDTLRVLATVLEARRSLSKPDRSIVKTMAEAVNQDGRTVTRATAINFRRVCPESDA